MFSPATSLAQAPLAQWVEHLGFNVTATPLDNLAVRQALASAIDRRAVFTAAKDKFSGGFIATGPAGSWFPPYLPQHDPEVRVHPYDISVAKKLLATAGFPDGAGLPELEILYRQDLPLGPVRALEAEIIKMQLAAVGVKTKPIGLPTGRDFFARLLPGAGRQGQFLLALFGWGAEKSTEDFLSSVFLQGGPQNVYGYRNADATLLMAAITREKDSAKRVALLREAERLILTDAPVVPLLYIYQSR
jgi:oligopeptide transport system substrate-binding protein